MGRQKQRHGVHSSRYPVAEPAAVGIPECSIPPGSMYQSPTIRSKLSDCMVEVLRLTYEEDFRAVDLKQYLGLGAIAVTAIAHFWPQPFPSNRIIVAISVVIYMAISLILFFLNSYAHPDVIFASRRTKKNPVVVQVSAFLPRYSDQFSFEITVSHDESRLFRGFSGVESMSEKVSVSIGDWICEDGTVLTDLISETVTEHISNLLTSFGESAVKKED